mgnify:CR=1 FL=1
MRIFNSRLQISAYCITATLLLHAMPCMADADTNLAVNATVTASPCALVATPEVDLGAYTSSNLTTAGSTTTWVPFKVDLEKCPSTSTTVTLTLGGTTDPVYTQYYKNTGTSTNVVIDVLNDPDGKALNPGTSTKINIDAKTHTASFPMKAQMVSPQGGATSGTVTGQMELTFFYG